MSHSISVVHYSQPLMVLGSPLRAFSSHQGTDFDNIIYAIAPAIDGFGILYAGGACMSCDGSKTDAMAALIDDGSLE